MEIPHPLWRKSQGKAWGLEGKCVGFWGGLLLWVVVHGEVGADLHLSHSTPSSLLSHSRSFPNVSTHPHMAFSPFSFHALSIGILTQISINESVLSHFQVRTCGVEKLYCNLYLAIRIIKTLEFIIGVLVSWVAWPCSVIYEVYLFWF